MNGNQWKDIIAARGLVQGNKVIVPEGAELSFAFYDSENCLTLPFGKKDEWLELAENIIILHSYRETLHYEKWYPYESISKVFFRQEIIK